MPEEDEKKVNELIETIIKSSTDVFERLEKVEKLIESTTDSTAQIIAKVEK